MNDSDKKISFLNYLITFRYRYLAGFLVLLATNGFALAIPWLIKLAIDEIQGPANADFLKSCAIFILLFASAYALLRVFSRILIFGAGRAIEVKIRQRLYDHLQTLDAPYFDRNPSGEIISLLTNDTNVLRLLFGMGFLNLANGFQLYILSATVMISLNPVLALWGILPYLLVIFLLRKLTPQFHIKSRILQEKIAELTDFIQENLSGQEVIRGFAVGDSESNRFQEKNKNYLDASMNLTLVRGILFTSTGAIGGLGILLLLWVGGHQVIRSQITLGDFVAFVGYITLLVNPTLMFGFVISIWQRARASLERVQKFLLTQPQIKNIKKPVLWSKKPQIEIKNLTFAYPSFDSSESCHPSEAVLKDFSLEVSEGKLTALVGPVGCGKSTLISLLARLYAIPEGFIFFDHLDINHLKISELRRNLAIVPQNPFLFSLSIYQNIQFGLESVGNASKSKIKEAAKKAYVGQAQGEKKYSIDAQVGERGILLSGGQKQRVALARALAKESPILLLDDPFSSLDSKTSNFIMESIQKNDRNQTILLITHKISLIQNAYQIAVMENGKIIHSGRHHDLIKNCEVYRDLYALEEIQRGKI